MKKNKKILSLFLALFIVLPKLGLALAWQGPNSISFASKLNNQGPPGVNISDELIAKSDPMAQQSNESELKANGKNMAQEGEEVSLNDTNEDTTNESPDIYDYITYAGDEVKYPISTQDENSIRWFSLVDSNSERARGEGKELVYLDERGLATIQMVPYHSTEQEKKEVCSDLTITVGSKYGETILETEDKQIQGTKYVFAQDYYGNKSWKPIRLTIKNQNSKGSVKPEEVDVLQGQLTEDYITDAIKNGAYTYNDGVPEQNKEGKNALHTTKLLGGKQVLDKYRSITVNDGEIGRVNKLEADTTDYVKATITYLDGSKSEVEVKVNVKTTVPTGLRGYGYGIAGLLLVFGIGITLISLFKFRKNKTL